MLRRLMIAATSSAATYSYWNPLDKAANATLSDSNKVVGGGSAGPKFVRSVKSRNSGKFRVQFVALVAPSSGSTAYGFATAGSLGSFLGGTANAWALWGNYSGSTQLYNNNAFTSYASGNIATNDVIDLLIDVTAGRAWWRINGAVVSGDPVAGTGAMATFTAGSTVFIAADPYVASQSTRLRTNPAEMTGAAVSGFTEGWPD